MIMAMRIKELIRPETAEKMALNLVAGEKGLDTLLTSARLQKPGLLLTGLLEGLHAERIQIFGAAEVGYLNSLGPAKLKRSLDVVRSAPIPAVIVTRAVTPPEYLVELAELKDMPLFSTPQSASLLIENLTDLLDDQFAPEVTMHGVLVDVLGIGILIIGKSGIGKSECALDLVSRGYRLVADDAVIVKKRHHTTLFGEPSDVISYHMEVRGLGIINVKDIYGITAIRLRKQMDLVIELVEWDPEGDYERLGLDDDCYELLGVELPYQMIPVSPGRSVATVVEVAARNRILKIMGYDPAREFAMRLQDVISDNSGDKT